MGSTILQTERNEEESLLHRAETELYRFHRGNVLPATPSSDHSCQTPGAMTAPRLVFALKGSSRYVRVSAVSEMSALQFPLETGVLGLEGTPADDEALVRLPILDHLRCRLGLAERSTCSRIPALV